MHEIFDSSRRPSSGAQTAGDIQCALMKQDSINSLIFILVSSNNHVHIRGSKKAETRCRACTSAVDAAPDCQGCMKLKLYEVAGDPQTFSSYEYLKARNPHVTVFQTHLIDKDRFGKDRKIEQYFLVNSRYQIQLLYPCYEDNSQKFRITDLIKDKYGIEYILDNDKFTKVVYRNHLQKGILKYDSQMNVTRQKLDLMKQLNLGHEWVDFDKNSVVQLVCDALQQQIVYVQNSRLDGLMVIYQKDRFTEEHFVRNGERVKQVKAKAVEEIAGLKNIPGSSKYQRVKALRAVMLKLMNLKKYKTMMRSNLNTMSRYDKQAESVDADLVREIAQS